MRGGEDDLIDEARHYDRVVVHVGNNDFGYVSDNTIIEYYRLFRVTTFLIRNCQIVMIENVVRQVIKNQFALLKNIL